nr:unnamed protein product [Callosobruchus analis]
MDSNNYRNWKRPLKLHELIAEIENIDDSDDEALIPDGIAVFHPSMQQAIIQTRIPATKASKVEQVILKTTMISHFLILFLKTGKISVKKVPKPDNQWKEKTDIALFSLFIDDEVVNLIAKYTNLYATQHNRRGDIASSEIRCFIGVLLLSGYNLFPRRSMYWEYSDDAENRLNFITQNLHLNDNSNLEQTDKMRPLFSILNKKFQLFAPFEECHSVDESVVPYYGTAMDQSNLSEESLSIGDTKYGWEQLGEATLNDSSHIKVLKYELTKRGIKCTGTLKENRLSYCPLRKTSLKKRSVVHSILYCSQFWTTNLVDNMLTQTKGEIFVVIGSMLLSGYSKYPNKIMYWSSLNDVPRKVLG